MDETWLRQKLPVGRSRASTLNRILERQEKEMIETALAILWASLRPVRSRNETRAAGANARLANQALKNQQLSLQNTNR